MPAAIPLAIVAGSAISGALANRGSKSTSTPTIDPAYKGLQGTVADMISQRLQGSTDLSGYTAGATGNINRTYDLVGQKSANDLTARGLGSSPIAGAVESNNTLARGGSIAQLINSIPLLQRQMQGEDLGLANSVLSQGRGVATTTSGNVAGGATSNAAAMLAYLYGKGAFASAGSSGMPGTPASSGF